MCVEVSHLRYVVAAADHRSFRRAATALNITLDLLKAWGTGHPGNLVAYAETIGRESGQAAPDPAKAVPHMVERFMATDRAFAKLRKNKAIHSFRTLSEAAPIFTDCNLERFKFYS